MCLSTPRPIHKHDNFSPLQVGDTLRIVFRNALSGVGVNLFLGGEAPVLALRQAAIAHTTSLPSTHVYAVMHVLC
jgi:hypothetical protein